MAREGNRDHDSCTGSRATLKRITLVNKLDYEDCDVFDLLGEIEQAQALEATRPPGRSAWGDFLGGPAAGRLSAISPEELNVARHNGIMMFPATEAQHYARGLRAKLARHLIDDQ